MNAPARPVLLDYREEWLVELVQLWRASFERGVGVQDPHPIEAQRRYFGEHVVPAQRVTVAFVEDRMAGFAAASPTFVSQLYVAIEHQRTGVGSALLDRVKAASTGQLELFTFARNRNARAFYRGRGFVELARGFERTWKLEDIRLRWCAR
jgi:GNAT superfamily N-acetyltransferase